MEPSDRSLSRETDGAGRIEAGASAPFGRGGRPGLGGLLLAVVVVLVVGGFALSGEYGVESIPSPSDLEEVTVTPSISGAPSSTVTTVPSSDPATGQPTLIDWGSFDWMYGVSDVDVTPDGLVYVVGGAGVASLDREGEWVLLDVDGLPEGAGLDDGWPGRVVDQITIGPDGTVWLAGVATSGLDDEGFGGILDGWTGRRSLWWVARGERCDGASCDWTAWTTNDVPQLAGDIGDIAIAGDGTVYAAVGENLLLEYRDQVWTSHTVPDLPTGWNGSVSPWTSSLAVGVDGVLWAGTDLDPPGRGVFAFSGDTFTRFTASDGLPGDMVPFVDAAADGIIWAATDALYGNPRTAAPDTAGGLARYDGTEWITYTMDDGLLSNDASIAAGSDGTVWAVHNEIPPYGYSRFDGSEWTQYPSDPPVGGHRAAVDLAGTLWTVFEGGLISFDGNTRTVHPSPFARPSARGAITVSIDRWEGVEGYRLLAAVSDTDSDLVGGAFWTIIDADPYSTTDTVHPPYEGEDPPGVEYESWGDGDYLWGETAWLPPGTYQITFWANPGDLAPYGSHLPASGAERECRVTVEVAAGYNTEVVISDIPLAGDGAECRRTTADILVEFVTFSPVRWKIDLDDMGPGVHTVFMVLDVHPPTAYRAERLSGRLIWNETVVDLCQIGFDMGEGVLQVGDIFQTTEGCGSNPTAMQDAFDQFGPPEVACVRVTVDGVNHEYCAPLAGTADDSVELEPGTVAVLLDGLEGLAGLAVDAWVVPTHPGDDWDTLGGANFGIMNEVPFPAFEVIHPPGENGYVPVDRSKAAVFEPGDYRFIIEAYVPSGDMRYGCEMPIVVADDRPLLVTITSLPAYTESGIHWTPLNELEYPDCPS